MQIASCLTAGNLNPRITESVHFVYYNSIYYIYISKPKQMGYGFLPSVIAFPFQKVHRPTTLNLE